MRRLSFDIFSEVKSIQVLMRGMDPDMRTVELKNWIGRSKRKLMQLYGLMRWLSLPNSSHIFRSVADFSFQLSTVDANMVRSLDELYFAHALVFSMRSRPYELLRAKDILCKSSYTALPDALFACGRPEIPTLLEPATVESDLDIFIRTKLALVDPLPPGMPLRASVASGVLCIEYTSYFALSLSLNTMDEAAPWSVLKCAIFLAADSSAKEAEDALLVQLRSVSHGKSLRVMLGVCLRASIDLGLRELHAQALRLPQASTFPDVLETAFVDSKEKYFRLRLWKSPFSGEYIFELRLVRRGNGVVVELRTKLVYEHVSLIFVDENRNLPIHGIADSWDGHRHIAGGPSFSRLLSEALILLDHLKLDIMAEVLESSLQKQGLSQCRLLRQTDSLDLLFVSSSGALEDTQVLLKLRVDTRNGRFVVESEGLQEVTVLGKRKIDLFVREINNQNVEQYVSNHLLKKGVDARAQTPGCPTEHQLANIEVGLLQITTLSDVVRFMALAWYAGLCVQVDRKLVNLQSLVPHLTQQCGFAGTQASNEGLVYNLMYWEETGGRRGGHAQVLLPSSFPVLQSEVLRGGIWPAAVADKASRKRKQRQILETGSVDSSAVDKESARRFSAVQHGGSVLSLYLLLELSDSGVLVGCALCRSSADGKGSPQLLSKHLLNTLVTSSAVRSALAQAMLDAVQWARNLTPPTVTLVELGFPLRSVSFLQHSEASFSAICADTSPLGRTTLHVVCYDNAPHLQRARESLRAEMFLTFPACGLTEGRRIATLHVSCIREEPALVSQKLDFADCPISMNSGDTASAILLEVFLARLLEDVFGSGVPRAASEVRGDLELRLHVVAPLLSLLRAISQLSDVHFRCMHHAVSAAGRPFSVSVTLALNIPCPGGTGPDPTAGYLVVESAWEDSACMLDFRDTMPGRLRRKHAVGELLDSDCELLKAVLGEFTAAYVPPP